VGPYLKINKKGYDDLSPEVTDQICRVPLAYLSHHRNI
jgi:hypothetical protein